MAESVGISKKSQLNEEVDSTADDNDIHLEFSGLSEDINEASPNGVVPKNSAKNYSDDLDNDVPLVVSNQAVRTDNHEHGLSDDEFPKTLTTLETVKKLSTHNDETEIEVSPLATEEDEEGTILLEVYSEENDLENGTTASAENGEQAIAEKQLVSIGRKPKIKQNIQNLIAKKSKNIIESAGKNVKREKKMKNDVISSKILTREEIQKEVVSKLVTPLSGRKTNVVTAVARTSGTIEIPRELVNSSEFDETSTPIIINHLKNTANKIDNDELIAILEGEDNIEHYEVAIIDDTTESRTSIPTLSKDEERQIAMQQMQNLPTKKKGRPRLDPDTKAARATAQSKKDNKNSSELVSSLVLDWSDSETKGDEQTETEILIEIRNDNGISEIKTGPIQKKRKIEPPPSEPEPPAFKRSRVIKKKIIWDPDAPETAINYASFAHTSGPGPRKKLSTKKPTQQTKVETVKPVHDESISSPIKKKKTSEIDKLLGDEGAINMLNSLNQENNNVEISNPQKSSRSKTVKSEPSEVTTVSQKAKTPRKDTKDASHHKQSTAGKKATTSPSGSNVTGKKRGPKSSAASWDYVYSSRPDDCMIIRRRSNSSYSSTASLNRLSIELPCAPPVVDVADDNSSIADGASQAKKSRNNKDKAFEFTKPTPKKPMKTEVQIGNAEVSRRSGRAQSIPKENATATTNNITPEVELKNESINLAECALDEINAISSSKETYKEIVLRLYNGFAEIVLKPHSDDDGDRKTLLTTQMMKEIESVLQLLETDKTCKLVLISSTNSTFCSGIDCSSLIQTTAEKRRVAAIDLSKKLCNFIKSLGAFKKLLVAAVKGYLTGFGVMMLPLFDIVLSQNDATFQPNDLSAGQLAVGSCIFSATNKLSYNIKAELLYFNENLNADQAKQHSLVTRILNWVEFDKIVLSECHKLSSNSTQVLDATKQLLQHEVIPKLKESVKLEQKHLLQYWISADYQEKLKKSLNQ